MQPFANVDELIAFLLGVSGSLSVLWGAHAITLLEDGAGGFRGYVQAGEDLARAVAREMEKEWLAEKSLFARRISRTMADSDQQSALSESAQKAEG